APGEPGAPGPAPTNPPTSLPLKPTAVVVVLILTPTPPRDAGPAGPFHAVRSPGSTTRCEVYGVTMRYSRPRRWISPTSSGFGPLRRIASSSTPTRRSAHSGATNACSGAPSFGNVAS